MASTSGASSSSSSSSSSASSSTKLPAPHETRQAQQRKQGKDDNDNDDDDDNKDETEKNNIVLHSPAAPKNLGAMTRTEKEEEETLSSSSSSSSSSWGVVGMAFRAMLVTMKKSSILYTVKKHAFLSLGKRTMASGAAGAASTSTTSLSSSSSPLSSLPPSTTTTTTTTLLPQWSKRVLALASRLFRNFLMGATVFGTYEALMYHHAFGIPHLPVQEDKEDKGEEDEEEKDETLVRKRPLWQHVAAGASAGVMQSLVNVALETLVTWRTVKEASPKRQQQPVWVMRHVWGDLMHTSIGYAFLFGSFEGFRRAWMEPLKGRVELWLAPNQQQEVFLTKVAASFLAGGMAGQVHHVVHHYTWHYYNNHNYAPQQLAMKLPKAPPLPPLRGVMAAFLPTAICFAAFQYGGELGS